MPKTHEFRVRPVTRYVVTEYVNGSINNPTGSSVVGEFDRISAANAVACALAHFADGEAFPLADTEAA